jgi:parallel beta helix pectate lyase-like protein
MIKSFIFSAVSQTGRTGLALAAGLALTATVPAARASAQIAVTSAADLAAPACPSSSRCTLRGALAAAASTGEAVELPAGAYDLTQGELTLCPGVSIAGSGARTTIVRPAPGQVSRVFEVLASGPPCGGAQQTSAITGLTITGGNPGSDGPAEGGGVLVDRDAVLSVAQSTISGNRAGGEDAGGGELGGASGAGVDVEADGTLTLAQSTVSGNVVGDPSAQTTTGGAGAGIYSGGSVTITDSTIAGNRSDYEGAGIFIGPGASVDLRNATVDGNAAGADWSGGNVYLDGSDAGSGSAGSGSSGPLGGILGATSGPASPGDDGTATLTTENSIIADGSAGSLPDCAASDSQSTAIRSLGNNLSSSTSCGLMAPGDIQNTSPQLGPLRDNGGATDTLAPQAGSPAIDAAADQSCPATDQRGIRRPQGAHCDIGAVEFDAVPATAAPAGPRLRDLRLEPRVFAATTRGSSILTGSHPGGRSAPGTLISFTDSAGGSVTFTVLRDRPGVLSAGLCRAQPKHPPAGSQRCVRAVALGSFRHAAQAGPDRLRFSGRLSGRALSGAYVLRATPHDATGAAGRSASATFVVS